MSQSHPTDVSRDLESASTRLVDLVRGLDRAESRDAVIEHALSILRAAPTVMQAPRKP